MKNNKGFTLIELLAVILILGIIALIAIPTVNGVIEESREGAAESSAREYIKSFEEKTITAELNGTTISNGDYSVSEIEDMNLDLSGTKPDEGFVHVTDNSVDVCELKYGNYIVNCDGDDVSAKKYDYTSWIMAENSSYIAKVYYNPTEGSKCSVDDFNTNLSNYENSNKDSNGNKSQTGLKDGCMIWYAYKDNGDGTINLILNHNTTALSAASSSDSDTDLSVLHNTLNDDTKNWKVSADVIDIDDIAHIVGADKVLGFSSQNSYYKDDSGLNTTGFSIFEVDKSYEKNPYKYFWLLENTYNFKGKYLAYIYDDNEIPYVGYKSKTYNGDIFGYWTKNIAKNDYIIDSYLYSYAFGCFTRIADEGYDGYFLALSNTMGANPSHNNNLFGIRPVITLSYDVFK